MIAIANPRTSSEIEPAPGPHAEIGHRVERSYWQRIGAMPKATTSGELPARAQYVIIGGGLAGLSTALRMKEMAPDADIVLLEAKSVGYGASGRNGGLISPLPAPVWLATALHDDAHSRALRLLNRKVGEAAVWASKLAPDAEVTGTALALEAKGSITDAGLAHVGRTLRHAGIEHRFPVGELNDGPRALHLAAYTVNPYKLVRGLAAAARARGISIIEGAPVREIEEHHEGGATILLRDGRRIDAATVVLATNAYTPSIAMREPARARVVHNYMLATEPLPPRTLKRLTEAGQASGQFVVELNAAYVFYRVHDGRLVFGGIEKLQDANAGDLDVPTVVMRGLRKHLAQTLAGSPLPPIAEAWGGRFHMTATDLPIIRRSAVSPSIVLNIGYGGTGVALTLSLAPVVAAIALGRDIADRELAEIYATMRNTRVPIVGALRFAAGVVATCISERFARQPGHAGEVA